MKPRHQVSKDAIELLKRFEGYRRVAAQLPDGGWTIGHGHTKTAREGAQVSESDAEALLLYDLLEVTRAVNELTFTPLTQNQFDALVCFAFNVGLDNFRRSSVLRRVNEGQMLQAACALEMWRKAEFEGERIVIDALVRRRAAEKALFLTPADGYVPAPSQVVRPRVDYDAACAQPKAKPLSLIVPMDGEVAKAHEDVAARIDAADGAPSPATVAADAVAARLQALVPDTVDTQGQAAEAEAGLDVPPPPEPQSEREREPAPEPAPQAVVWPVIRPIGPLVHTPVDFTTAPPTGPASSVDEALFVSPEPQPAPVEAPVEVAVESLAPEIIEESTQETPLPFEDLQPAPESYRPAPLRAEMSHKIVLEDDRAFASPARDAPLDIDFGVEAEPLRFNVGPLVALAGGGLLALGFAIFWALNTSHQPGAGVGSLAVSWASGLVGVVCIAVAVYLLLERLGGTEE